MWLRVHDGHKLILQIKHLTFWSRFFLPSYTWKGSDEHQAPNPNITILQTLELVTTPRHVSNVQFPSVLIDTNVYTTILHEVQYSTDPKAWTRSFIWTSVVPWRPRQFNLGKPGFDSFVRTLLQQVYSILLKMVALLFAFQKKQLHKCSIRLSLNVGPSQKFRYFSAYDHEKDQDTLHISKENPTENVVPAKLHKTAEHCITPIKLQVSPHASTNLQG